MHLLCDVFLQPDLLTILYAVYTDEVLQPEKKNQDFLSAHWKPDLGSSTKVNVHTEMELQNHSFTLTI